MPLAYLFRRYRWLLLWIIIPIGVLLWREWTFSGAILSPQALPKKSAVIDIHCHIACQDETQGCFISTALRENIRYPIYFRLMHTSEDALQQNPGMVADYISAQLKQSRYVDKAVVLALDGVVDHGRVSYQYSQLIVPNDFVFKQIKKHDNLLFGASINPYRDDALFALERVHRQGAVLVKWIPSIMNIDPADPALIPFYHKLIALKLPLLTHTGKERAFTAANDDLSDPKRLLLPLSLGVTVIAAHVASTGEHQGMDDFDQLLPMLLKYDHLYADISSLTQINKMHYMKKLLHHPEVHHRLLYGTDWPLPFFPLVSPWYFHPYLTLAEMWALSGIGNTWDADVRLKQALGIPSHVFSRTQTVLFD